MVCIAVDRETSFFYLQRVMKHPIHRSQVKKSQHYTCIDMFQSVQIIKIMYKVLSLLYWYV